ncbi:DUF4157 domain-containing protein [Flavihumibacter sp. R14]|nr:DUF4157 domain-containing protein [Flavihumibacter soli]
MPEAAVPSLNTQTNAAAVAGDVMPLQAPDMEVAYQRPFQHLTIQAKLTLGAPDDLYEKEADAVADKVMRMPDQNFIQRNYKSGQEEKIQREENEENEPADKSKLKLQLTQPDFLSLRTPFFERNAMHLWDPDSALGVWRYNFGFFKRFGLDDNWSGKAANLTAPLFINSQLKIQNPTWWEVTDQQLNTTSIVGSLPIFSFDSDFRSWKPLPFLQKKTLGYTADDVNQDSPKVNFIQRKCTHCEEEEKINRKPLSASITSFIQTKTERNTPAVSDSLSQSIQSSKGGGSFLDGGTQTFMSDRFGTDFGNVKVHTDGEAIQMNRELNAKAFTVGHDVYFNEGQYQPGSADGKRLLAHELTHTVQQGASGQRNENQGALKENFIQRKCADPQDVVQCDEEEKASDNPFAEWKNSEGSLLLIYGDDKLFILPGSPTAYFPTEASQKLFEQSAAHYTQDMGTLFEVPATGASGTRIFKAGNKTAMVLDAGYDPTPGQSRLVAQVYMNQVLGITGRLGITKVTRIIPIHGHSDHVVGIPTIVTRLNVKASNVVIPKAFETIRAVDNVKKILVNTTDPSLTIKGFGSSWIPERPPKDNSKAGDIYRGSFFHGELLVEMLGIRSALKSASSNPDLASYLTKVTRRTDGAKVVILGDFHGADLESMRTKMESQATGSWNEFFRGVNIVSGFSHHAGAMKPGDVAGMMALLDATLLSGGKLKVVEQTNVGVASKTRADTLELAARLGIEVSYTGMPSTGSTPSAIGATRDSTYKQGPHATIQPIINSGLTIGLSRLQRMSQDRKTIEQWRPWLEEINGSNGKQKIDAVLAEYDSSIGQLRQSLRAAAETALNVRAAKQPAGATGARNYSETGGAFGQAYVAATSRIPAAVPAEINLTPESRKALTELEGKNIEEVPLKVALYRAITYGEFSSQAFTKMLGQLNPITRDELIGRRAGSGRLVPRHVAFERVRSQIKFEQSVLPGETISLSGFSPAGKVRARGVGGVLLALELWNSIGQPLLDSHRVSKEIKISKDMAPFIRRLAFWQRMNVKTTYAGFVDPSFSSPTRIDGLTNAQEILQKLKDGDLDALVIEKPGLTDADVFAFAEWLRENIRNYDEYASLFEDSFQDALKFDAKGGNWAQSDWKIAVGHYETSGSNHVVEEYFKHDKLTQFMQYYIPWLITNTNILLNQVGDSEHPIPDANSLLGTLSPNTHSKKRVRLKKPKDKVILRVPVTGNVGGGGWNRSSIGATSLAEVTFPNPPTFYVLDKVGDEIKIMGADFGSYAAIRDLETVHREIGTHGANLNHEFFSKDRNQGGWAWIDEILTQPVDLAPAPATSVPAPLAPSQVIKSPIVKPLTDDPFASKPGLGPQIFAPLPGDKAGEKDPSILPGLRVDF